MELLPVVCLCLLTRCGITSADGNEPVVVRVKQDEDALLPCSRSTKDIEQGYFDWNKVAQNNETQKEVFRYEKGKHSPSFGAQDGGFKGRVSHFPEELKHGNTSIIIRKTKRTDNGDYTCTTFTEPLQTFHIKLVVDCVLKDRTDEDISGTCPKPNLRTLGPTKDGMLLQCEVQGAFPKPKVEWKDSSGKILSAEEPQVTDRGDRYDIILRVTVTKTDNYICVSTQEEICHQISAYTYVPVNGFPIVAVVVSVLCTVVVGVVVFAIWHKKKRCNGDSQTARKDGSGVPLNGQSSQSA